MFNAIIKDNLGKTISHAPCCMTLDQAMKFADASAISYRRENANSRGKYPYCSITITSDGKKWSKWFPAGTSLEYSEC